MSHGSSHVRGGSGGGGGCNVKSAQRALSAIGLAWIVTLRMRTS